MQNAKASLKAGELGPLASESPSGEMVVRVSGGSFCSTPNLDCTPTCCNLSLGVSEGDILVIDHYTVSYPKTSVPSRTNKCDIVSQFLWAGIRKRNGLAQGLRRLQPTCQSGRPSSEGLVGAGGFASRGVLTRQEEARVSTPHSSWPFPE